MIQGFGRIIIILSLLLIPSWVCAQYSVDFEIETDANNALHDTSELKAPPKIKYDWLDLLRSRRLNVSIDDPDVHYPKFIDFCLKVYRWADHTFNYYDPLYVVPSEKPGKVRLTSDNWLDMHYIRFADGGPLVMVSTPYSNIGFHVNYHILSFGYSIDLNTIISKQKSTNRKWNMSITSARLYAEAFMWQNDGKTNILDFGDIKHSSQIDFAKVPFDGLNFRALGLLGLYIFNYKKFSYMAGYNMSPIQIKSQGSWIAGISGAFYTADFDFMKLPAPVAENANLLYNYYRFNYNSINLLGGYSYNWVINKHFLINVGLLLGQGVTFSYEDSSTGKETLYSSVLRGQASVTYTNRQFFLNMNNTFHGNLFITDQVGFMSGIDNFQFSAGIRF